MNAYELRDTVVLLLAERGEDHTTSVVGNEVIVHKPDGNYSVSEHETGIKLAPIWEPKWRRK